MREGLEDKEEEEAVEADVKEDDDPCCSSKTNRGFPPFPPSFPPVTPSSLPPCPSSSKKETLTRSKTKSGMEVPRGRDRWKACSNQRSTPAVELSPK